MNIQNYLQQRLEGAWKYDLTEEDTKAIQIEGIEKYVFRKLKSKKFRKTKIDDDSIQKVQDAIKINVEKREPIKITYPFGGYKIWRLPSFPSVDWAEFMTFAHVLEYTAPILSAYEPGVDIKFSSDDIVIELLDNYRREDLDAYVSSFEELIKVFSKHFPSNLKLSLERVANLYSKDEYEKELQENYRQFKKDGLPEERVEKDFKLSEFNFNLNGKVDHTKASEKELEELKRDLMYWSQAYLALKKRRAFVRGEEKVVLFSSPISNAIDIGSTRVSKAKFWAGTGVIEMKGDTYLERILSPKQYDEVKDNGRLEDIDLIDMPNFENILVFDKRLHFLSSP